MGIVPSETFSHGGDIILLFSHTWVEQLLFFTTLEVINNVKVLMCQYAK
jgi:hypothetical protein